MVAYSTAGDRVIFLAYAALVVGGQIAVGAECQEARFFRPDALPPLAFPHDAIIVRGGKASPGPGSRFAGDARTPSADAS